MQITSDFNQKIAKFPASATSVLEKIPAQLGKLDAAQVEALKITLGLSLEELMIQLLPVAASLSVAEISDFHVGVVAEGLSGSLYLGANLEFTGLPLKATVHAEQFAVVNAWHRGEQGLKRLVVNEAPCGHCRQFLNELCRADQLQVIVHSDSRDSAQHYSIGDLLPDRFGPADLGMEDGALMCDLSYPMDLPAEFEGDELAEVALFAASKSYAPVCQSRAGIALRLKSGRIVTGRYGANAAFNPGVTAMESAAVNWRLALLQNPDDMIEEAVMVEQPTKSSQKELAVSFLDKYGIALRYIQL
ncbi:cytidine deaminase [Endozoicomonas arenosclerae]|uniref:cytidine deaminase n=1 Tax=Endozoicomonas arenosclerae TaxID=1633495 RepID=UPI0007830BD1|nr:cytidine deaminase [Endozoicomonas arenosclerae]